MDVPASLPGVRSVAAEVGDVSVPLANTSDGNDGNCKNSALFLRGAFTMGEVGGMAEDEDVKRLMKPGRPFLPRSVEVADLSPW